MSDEQTMIVDVETATRAFGNPVAATTVTITPQNEAEENSELEVEEQFTGELAVETTEEAPAKTASEQSEALLPEKTETQTQIEEEESNTEKFFKAVAEAEEKNKKEFPKIKSANELVQTIQSTWDYSQLKSRIENARQRQFKVVEIKIEESPMVMETIKRVLNAAETERHEYLAHVRAHFNNEIVKLDKVYRETLIGKTFLNLAQAIDPLGWVLIMKGTEVLLLKDYGRGGYPVIEGFGAKTGQKKVKFLSPVCVLSKITVKVTHPYVTTGTIKIVCKEGQHPNVNDAGAACTGNLSGKPIEITDTTKMYNLLVEIMQVYQRVHLDSMHRDPRISYKTIERDTAWTS